MVVACGYSCRIDTGTNFICAGSSVAVTTKKERPYEIMRDRGGRETININNSLASQRVSLFYFIFLKPL